MDLVGKAGRSFFEPRDGRLAAALAARYENDAGAHRGEFQCSHFTNARCAAGDDDRLALHETLAKIDRVD